MSIEVKYNEPLSRYTTFKIGGAVREMYFPGDAEQAVWICDELHRQGVTPVIIGNGSNILASDADLDIAVINTTKLRFIELCGTTITAGSGVLLSELASYAQKNGLTGLEFAHGIPGTLGGAVLMNAGAYGGEMSSIVQTTAAYSTERGKYTVSGSEHEFSYRNSVFTRSGDLILSSTLCLKKGDKAEIARKMQELAERRRESQPLEMPSAGSTFKRPKVGYAAQLIEQAGLKGYAIGAAQVSPKHAGFIVNTGGATFDDVMRLIEHVQDVVEKDSGIMLELEVRIIR